MFQKLSDCTSPREIPSVSCLLCPSSEEERALRDLSSFVICVHLASVLQPCLVLLILLPCAVLGRFSWVQTIEAGRFCLFLCYAYVKEFILITPAFLFVYLCNFCLFKSFYYIYLLTYSFSGGLSCCGVLLQVRAQALLLSFRLPNSWGCLAQPHVGISSEFLLLLSFGLGASMYDENRPVSQQGMGTTKETTFTKPDSKAESPFLSSRETKRVSKH